MQIRLSYLINSVAWYTATTTAGMKSNTANGVMSISDPSYQASAVDLPLKVVVNRDDAKYDSDETAEGENLVYKTLELAHWCAASDATASHSAITAGLNTAYWDPNHTFLTYSTSAHADKVVTGVSREKFTLYATYNVTVKIDKTMDGWSGDTYTDSNGGKWTAAQIANELKSTNISVTLARADASSYAMFFSLGTSAVAAAAEGSATPGALNTTLPSTIPSDGTESAAFAKFGLYVDGEGRTNNIDDAAVSGNFTVTVAKR